jgi:DNA polymerase-1
VFGLCYGQGARGLSEELKISEKEADTFLKKFFKEFPSVEKWISNTKKAANKNGYVETFFGRRRRLPDAMLKDDFHSAKNRAMRQAINQPIQGTAADILSLKMTDVYNFIKSENLNTQMMLTVHDSLGFSVPPDELNFFVSMAKVIVEDFSSLPEIKVPILCDFEIGKRWGELTPIDKLGFEELEQGVNIELILERLNNG